MTCSTWRRIGFLAFFIALVGAPVAAQDTGTISGTIVDNSGQIVPGASVTLTNEATRDSRSAVSDGRGEFAFRAVPPGSYTVKVEFSGFRTIETQKNVLNANSRLDLGILRLEIGTLSEIISVTAEGAGVVLQGDERGVARVNHEGARDE